MRMRAAAAAGACCAENIPTDAAGGTHAPLGPENFPPIQGDRMSGESAAEEQALGRSLTPRWPGR